MSSPVEQVFNVPELLESILINMHDGRNLTPQTHLFVLQRVNSSFKGTIEGSRVLRRQMWLEYPDRNTSVKDPLNPILWLSDQSTIPAWTCCSSRDKYVELDGSRIVPPERSFLVQYDDKERRRIYERLQQCPKQSVPSWRRMKFSLRGGDKDAEIRWCIAWYEPYDTTSSLQLPDNQPTDVHLTLRFGEGLLGTTLGDVADAIERITTLAVAERIEEHRNSPNDDARTVAWTIPPKHVEPKSEETNDGECTSGGAESG